MPNIKFEDPLWQLTLYVGMNPMFRLMHADKHNVVSWLLGVLAASSLWRLAYWYALYAGTLGLFILIAKHYLVCGAMYNVYLTDRHYNNSTLDTSDPSVPTLYLNGATPFDNGFDYGIIMAEEIIHLVRRFKKIAGLKVPAWVLKDINNNLPDNIKSEIRGMYEAIDSVYFNTITYWDLLAIQLVPELDNLGCTCYATRSDNKKVILGRNMDWLPFSSAQYSIVVCYRNHNYKSLVVPGLIGCVTAWKDKFAIAMNVVGLERELDTKLLPSTLFNKMIMIQANTYEQATKLASDKHPASPYHLTIAGALDCSSFSYYQGEHENTHVRRMSEQSENFAVLNWTYPDCQHGRYISDYRNTRTRELKNTGYDHVVDILRQCQTFETMHTVVFDFSCGDLQVTIGIDNGFAADQI